jgi:hypothetical protein
MILPTRAVQVIRCYEEYTIEAMEIRKYTWVCAIVIYWVMVWALTPVTSRFWGPFVWLFLILAQNNNVARLYSVHEELMRVAGYGGSLLDKRQHIEAMGELQTPLAEADDVGHSNAPKRTSTLNAAFSTFDPTRVTRSFVQPQWDAIFPDSIPKNRRPGTGAARLSKIYTLIGLLHFATYLTDRLWRYNRYDQYLPEFGHFAFVYFLNHAIEVSHGW